MTDLLPATTDAHDTELAGFVRQLFTESRRHKRRRLDAWERYYRMLRNRSWSEQRAPWLPSPSSSEFWPVVHTLVSWMTDSPPVFNTSPDPDLQLLDAPPDPELLRQKAVEMGQVIESWWSTSAAALQLEMALWDTFTFGCGILKTGYDPLANGGLGSIDLTRRDPWSILPDPDASSTDDCRYLIDVSTVSYVELLSRFPERGHLVRPTGAGLDVDRRPRDQGGFQLVDQQGLAATGVTGTFPGTSTPGIPPLWGPDMRGFRPEDYTGSVLLVEAWIRDTDKQTIPVIVDGEIVDQIDRDTPCWRYVAVAGDVVLTPETTNPFPHGQLPYVRLPYSEVGEWWSIPLAEHLMPAQVAINHLLAALQINAELTGNPIFIEPSQAGIARTKITNRPGGRLTFNQGFEPKWLNPPQMPAQVMQLVNWWKDSIRTTAGTDAIRNSGMPARRETAQAVDATQEASFVRIRAVLRNMERALKVVGDHAAANVVGFYVEPRIVPLIADQGSQAFLQLSPRHFTYPQLTSLDPPKIEEVPLSFQVFIEAGSSQPLSRASRIAEMDTLRFMQLVDGVTTLKAHRIPNAEEVFAKAQAEAAQGAQQADRQNPRRSR